MPVANDVSAASPPRRSRARRAAFTVVALLIPALFFLIVEFALRLAGVGGYPSLFVPVASAPDYLQPNEQAIERFFARADLAPQVSIDTTYFAADKPADALRVFVQGGSSAAGFPYGKWASPAGMLGHRLRRSFPERDIEVVSTAMSAVNSYALLDFADEIIAQRPDAVVIYAGHNEFLGVLGVGSAFSSSQSRAWTRAILALRRLHSYRLIERVFSTWSTPAAAARSGTLMARIAGERRIAFGSEMYLRGVAQFRANMSALLSRYHAAGVVVFVGTLASNERDQRPFTSALAPQTDAAAWQVAYDAGVTAFELGDTRSAIASLEAAIALDDGAADAWYAMGQAQELAGELHSAREAYQAARDRDQLRFRAPGAFNAILRELATEHGAILVDVEGALAAESQHGIIGDDVLLEHLHPNVRGYFLLADAYFDALGAARLIGPWDQAIDDANAWRQQPVTEIDALAAQYRLARLLTDWPFQQQKQPFSLPVPTTPQEQIAQAWYTQRIPWAEAMNRALVYYQQQGDLDNAVRVALNLADAFHFLGNVQYIAGQLLTRSGERGLALHYLERAVVLEPRPEHLLALATVQRDAGSRDAARQTLDMLLARDPRNADALRLRDGL